MNNQLTPEQYIKRKIVKRATDFFKDFFILEDLNTPEGIEAAYDRGDENDFLQDARDEFRGSGLETDLPAPYNRNYETEIRAMEVDSGVWVGWVYYYGGGKHGEPEAIPWMEDAFFVDCKEEQKVVTVRTFAKR